MTLIIKILAVAALHLAFFSAYPETGSFGSYYLGISLLVWTVFIMFVNTSAKLVKLISGIAGLVINLAAFLLMALAIAATMPQSDRTSVLEKLQKGAYPAPAAMKAGMRRLFRGNFAGEVGAGVRQLDDQAGKALKKLKK